MTTTDVRSGAGVYSRPVLALYDLLVVHFSSSLAWRCPNTRMLARYHDNVGRRHLDVGPGTGWYLERADLHDGAEVTLMDLNPNSLRTASSRLSRAGLPPEATVRADVLDAGPQTTEPFDSVGINYLLHCLPGTWSEKDRALANLAGVLGRDGVLFGSTVLGSGVRHNLLGRGLMRLYNRTGVFHNRQDDLPGLEAALGRHFEQVEVDLVGTVAVFTASRPRA